ncbi:MAG: hypothetical protein ACI4VW_00535, partial [Acutalibacteraceae bacterium]
SRRTPPTHTPPSHTPTRTNPCMDSSHTSNHPALFLYRSPPSLALFRFSFFSYLFLVLFSHKCFMCPFSNGHNQHLGYVQIDILIKLHNSLSMGKLNIINANYMGKVGENYGTKWKNKSVIKAVPFSHAPHNEKQKNAWSAFQRLNRFVAYYSKNMSQYSSLSFKNKNKINVFATFFKNLIANGSFNINNIFNVINTTEKTEIIAANFYADLAQIQITLQKLKKIPYAEKDLVFIGCINQTSKHISCKVVEYNQENVILPYQPQDILTGAIYCFRMAKVQNKWRWINAGIAKLNIIENGILYCSRFTTAGAAKVINGILVGTDKAFSGIQDGILKISNT